MSLIINFRNMDVFSKSAGLIRRTNSVRLFKRCASVITDVHDFDEIPAPRGLPIIGTTLSLIAAGSAPKLHEYVDKRHKQLGPIYKEKLGPVSAVFISHPEYMRNVFANEGKYPMHVIPEPWMIYNEMYQRSRGLFFMNGKEWLHFRKILNKYLLRSDNVWIENACDVVSESMIKKIDNVIENGGMFPNLEYELYLWSIEVLVAILLGAEAYRSSYMRIRLLMQLLASKVHLIFATTSKLSLYPASLAAKLNIAAWKKYKAAVDDSLEIGENLVNILLHNCPEGDGLLKKLNEENVQLSDITRIVSDLVLAAGDTTAYSMEWILYCLAKNPTVQEDLRQQTDNRDILLKNILKETLRLYPVAPFLTRILPDDCIVGGYRIPAKTLLILSIYTSGRDERYFANPEEFQPDRWIRTETSAVNSTRGLMRHASLPFAMGVRSCVGKKIAETQLQMTLGKIIDNFRVTLCNQQDVDVVLKMIVVPSETLLLRFDKLK